MNRRGTGHPLWWMALGALLTLLVSGGSYWWGHPSVRLTVDGQTRVVPLQGRTVGDLLAREAVTLGPLDRVLPSPESPLRRRLALRVIRVRHEPAERLVAMPPIVQWQERSAQNLREVLVQRGYGVERRQQVVVIRHDGREVARQVVRDQAVRRPFHQLTLFNERGLPVQSYDLLKVPAQDMVATGYYVGDPLVPSDTTFLGYKLRRGLVAVDPKVIPLRTRLYIPGYGYGYAADTGSKIKKNRIDLAVRDAREERRYMHRTMRVYRLGKARTW